MPKALRDWIHFYASTEGVRRERRLKNEDDMVIKDREDLDHKFRTAFSNIKGNEKRHRKRGNNQVSRLSTP